MSDVKGRELFSCGKVVNVTLTWKIAQPRARRIDASVRAGLARQLRLQSREVTISTVLYTLVHSCDKMDQALSPNFDVLQIQRSFAGIIVRA